MLEWGWLTAGAAPDHPHKVRQMKYAAALGEWTVHELEARLTGPGHYILMLFFDKWLDQS